MAVANRNIRALFLATALCLAAARLSPAAAQAPAAIVPGAFTDKMDGKTYKTVTIGKQTWMAENMNTETGASWCYGGDVSNCNVYGRLYDWVTAKSLCPSGWRLPSVKEWSAFVTTAGGNADESGLLELPGGGRYRIGGDYGNIGGVGYWWADTENANQYSYYRYADYSIGNKDGKFDAKDYAFSVRCVMDGK
jgi:hypothetical protein